MRVSRRGRKRADVKSAVARRGLWGLLDEYLDALRVQDYAPETVRTRQSNLGQLLRWCDERSVVEATEVTPPVLERFQRHLYYYRRPDGRPIGFGAQYHLLSGVRQFFRWLARRRVILFNPAAELQLPRRGRRLPRLVLTADQAQRVLDQPNVALDLGIRDRAILETLYSTGIRRKELAQMTIYDLDVVRGTLMVRQGKGRKDRVVPIGETARAWIDRYVVEVRPGRVVDPDERHLFLTVDGDPFHRLTSLSLLVNKYLKAAGLGKTGGCHVFRHTMATLMLENGADVRFIQEMLGHADLGTTEVYTHVTLTKLKQIHRATHPAEHRGRTADPPGDPGNAAPRPPQDAAAVLAVLADEHEAEIADDDLVEGAPTD